MRLIPIKGCEVIGIDLAGTCAGELYVSSSIGEIIEIDELDYSALLKCAKEMAPPAFAFLSDKTPGSRDSFWCLIKVKNSKRTGLKSQGAYTREFFPAGGVSRAEAVAAHSPILFT